MTTVKESVEYLGVVSVENEHRNAHRCHALGGVELGDHAARTAREDYDSRRASNQ